MRGHGGAVSDALAKWSRLARRLRAKFDSRPRPNTTNPQCETLAAGKDGIAWVRVPNSPEGVPVRPRQDCQRRWPVSDQALPLIVVADLQPREVVTLTWRAGLSSSL